MTATPEPFESLLAARARIGWGMSVATPRPSMVALYEFGGGFPDPASFPYDGMVEATARMIREEGAAAMTYGDAQGYRGLRELICHKYDRFELLSDVPLFLKLCENRIMRHELRHVKGHVSQRAHLLRRVRVSTPP